MRCAEFSPDGRLVASCGDDKTIKLWDAQSHGCVHTFYDHAAQVCSVKFHPDGTCLASASADSTIRLFDARTFQLLQQYEAPSSGVVTDLQFHPSGSVLISLALTLTLTLTLTLSS